MTTVIVQYKPADLIRAALFAALQSLTLRWTLLALVMVLFAINLHQQRSHLTPVTWIAIILTVAIFTAGALLLMLAVTGLSALLRSRRGSTAAEVHTFSLTTEGLARRSASSDSN